MAVQYSAQTVGRLEEAFRQARLERPLRVQRYEDGTELTYQMQAVAPAGQARVRLVVDKFVGGGFAGQVYRIKVLAVEPAGADRPIAGLAVGGTYAMKILIPPSGGSVRFRNFVYKLGSQGPFSMQVNPDAARAGALWQKFIRRGAGVRFGDERAVKDILATFVDSTLGSCGEISEWVEGRRWRFEVDDRLDLRRAWARGRYVPADQLGSPEYRAWRVFMADMVKLLHEMGAPELARQYEWSTCKSQPNVMKRTDCQAAPAAGLTAMDFRAGLALLPFLPMSPGDFKLIGKGIARGSLVQFDRGDLAKLQRFVDAHAERFADLRSTLEELKQTDQAYRRSLPDITHHHVRLLYDRKLWGSILDGAVTGWQIRNVTDEAATASCRRSRLRAMLFAATGLIGLLGLGAAAALAAACLATRQARPALWIPAVILALAAPLAGRLIRRLAGRADYRRHYRRMLCDLGYFRRAIRARTAESLIQWVRAGRVGDARALTLAGHPWLFLAHLPFSVLPARIHRLLTDSRAAWQLLRYVVARPLSLYFNPRAREQWLRDMVADGQRKGMVSDQDAQRILGRIQEPFIQKYLKCLAVHVCLWPTTHVVAAIVAVVAVLNNPQWSAAEAWGYAALILGFFQIIPISPGSLARGFYVVYLVARERNVKDYNIAAFLAFFKYVGYLAFPIQMAYRYPELARFMAGHWATEAVHVVPVFGEHGALLEHGVFDLFYNRPLTIRRRMRRKAEMRATLAPRRWHVWPVAAGAAALLAGADLLWLARWGQLPPLPRLWLLAAGAPMLAGAVVAACAGGASLARRIRLAAMCGAIAGAAYAVIHALLAGSAGAAQAVAEASTRGPIETFAISAVWRVFLFTLLTAIGAILAEALLPEGERR